MLAGRALVAVTAVLLAVGHVGVARADARRPAVLALTLPNRRADAAGLARRVHAVGTAVAARLSIPIATDAELEPKLDLSARFDEARRLAVSGSLDDAAVMLDVALTAGAESPHRLARPADLVTGHITRISIALARGEARHAGELVDRLVRYDPRVELEAGERSPPVTAALADATRGTAMRATELGAACREYAVVIAARPAGPGAAMEFVRFDACEPVAMMIASADRDRDVIAALGAPPLPAGVEPVVRERGRGYRIAGVITGALGVVALGVGTYYGIDASRKAGAIADGCTPLAPCSGALLRERGDALADSRLRARVLWSIGGAAVVTGAVLYVVGRRRGESASPAIAAPVPVVFSDGAGIAWGTAF